MINCRISESRGQLPYITNIIRHLVIGWNMLLIVIISRKPDSLESRSGLNECEFDPTITRGTPVSWSYYINDPFIIIIPLSEKKKKETNYIQNRPLFHTFIHYNFKGMLQRFTYEYILIFIRKM